MMLSGIQEKWQHAVKWWRWPLGGGFRYQISLDFPSIYSEWWSWIDPHILGTGWNHQPEMLLHQQYIAVWLQVLAFWQISSLFFCIMTWRARRMSALCLGGVKSYLRFMHQPYVRHEVVLEWRDKPLHGPSLKFWQTHWQIDPFRICFGHGFESILYNPVCSWPVSANPMWPIGTGEQLSLQCCHQPSATWSESMGHPFHSEGWEHPLSLSRMGGDPCWD